MIEENVISVAGANHQATEDLLRTIEKAGFKPGLAKRRLSSSQGSTGSSGFGKRLERLRLNPNWAATDRGHRRIGYRLGIPEKSRRGSTPSSFPIRMSRRALWCRALHTRFSDRDPDGGCHLFRSVANRSCNRWDRLRPPSDPAPSTNAFRKLANRVESDLDIVPEMDIQVFITRRPRSCVRFGTQLSICPVDPSEKVDEPQSLIDLGTRLGKALTEEQGACVVAGLSLPQRNTSAPESEVTADATILRHILDPDPHLFFESSLQGKLRNMAPMLVALGQAKERHGLKGHLLEHGEVESANTQWGAALVI